MRLTEISPLLRPVHATLEFENGGYTLTTHQMFSRRISVDLRPNRRIKAAFLKFPWRSVYICLKRPTHKRVSC